MNRYDLRSKWTPPATDMSRWRQSVLRRVYTRKQLLNLAKLNTTFSNSVVQIANNFYKGA